MKIATAVWVVLSLLLVVVALLVWWALGWRSGRADTLSPPA